MPLLVIRYLQVKVSEEASKRVDPVIRRLRRQHVEYVAQGVY